MKGHSIRILALTLMIFGFYDGLPQAVRRYVPRNPVVCYYNTGSRHDHVAESHAFKALRNGAAGRRKSAAIEVEYINFPEDELAKAAFQYAINIWETELMSPVPIRIRAEWADLEAGVLVSLL